MKEYVPNKNSNLEKFMPFLSVDVIVSDIDGTLVSGDGTTIRQVRDIINTLGREKIYFSIATGRTYTGVKELLKSINLKRGIPIALYNGGIILEYGTTNVLSINELDNKECMKLLNLLIGMKINAYVYTFNINQKPIMIDNENRIEEKVYGIGSRIKEYDVNGIKIIRIKNVTEISGGINAILIEKDNLPSEIVKKVLMIIQEMTNVICTDSGNGFLELKKFGVDKGVVIESLRKFVELQRGDKKGVINVLAIGDNDNDLELFQKADIGVAVANASALAIKEADYICEKESSEGFLDMLNAIRIARKYYGDD